MLDHLPSHPLRNYISPQDSIWIEFVLATPVTEEKPKLTSIITSDNADQDQLLQLVANLEKGSEHPLAGAIIEGAKSKNLSLLAIENFQSITGKGVIEKAGGK
jgi:cation transport ATPase